jgi:hypothetical protein
VTARERASLLRLLTRAQGLIGHLGDRQSTPAEIKRLAREWLDDVVPVFARESTVLVAEIEAEIEAEHGCPLGFQSHVICECKRAAGREEG